MKTRGKGRMMSDLVEHCKRRSAEKRSLSSSVHQTSASDGARHTRKAVTALTADNPRATRLCLCFIPPLARHGNLLCFLLASPSFFPLVSFSPSCRLFFLRVKWFSRWRLAVRRLVDWQWTGARFHPEPRAHSGDGGPGGSWSSAWRTSSLSSSSRTAAWPQSALRAPDKGCHVL